jgi:hypothetical protein
MASFEATTSAFIAQSHVVEQIMADAGDLSIHTRLKGWDGAVLANHLALSLNLPRLVGTVDDDCPQIDPATWAERTRDFADEIDQMSIGLAAKKSHDEIRTQFAQYAAVGRAFVESASVELKVGLPAWQVWLLFSEFLLGRVIELTVHGLDLADAVGSAQSPAPAAVELTAQLMEDQLDGARPSDLGDDVTWIEAATGRIAHRDERLPVYA